MRIIAGTLKGRTVGTGARAPKGVRPTTDRMRETLFNVLHNHIVWDEIELAADVCAGTGALGFEAISRGVQQVIFIEKQRKTADLIKSNAAMLGIEQQTHIMALSAEQALRIASEKGMLFDLILTDPPYALRLASKLLLLSTSLNLLRPGSFFVAETAFDEHLPVQETKFDLLDQRKIGQTTLWTLQYAP